MLLHLSMLLPYGHVLVEAHITFWLKNLLLLHAKPDVNQATIPKATRSFLSNTPSDSRTTPSTPIIQFRSY